LSEAAFLQIMP